MGSFSANRPSSNSMSAAAEVIGYVIEAMRNSVSRSIGSLASTSRHPTPAAWITLPARQTSVAAPASSPALTIAPIAAEIESSSFRWNVIVIAFDGLASRLDRPDAAPTDHGRVAVHVDTQVLSGERELQAN